MSTVAGTEPQTARHRQQKPTLSEGAKSERKLGLWLCAPAVVVMALVTFYPIVYSFIKSLQKSNLAFPNETKFIGITNYTTVLTSYYWWHALLVTVAITVISVAVELVLGMGIALVMHKTIYGRGIVRTVILVPYGIVTIAAGFGWQYAWTPGIGYIGSLLPSGSAPLTQQFQSIGVIILAEIWKTTPFMSLLLLAGLALVPDELLRASQMDGATAWQRFVRVMLPLMKPAILVALLFRTLDAFRIFDNIFALTSGANGTESVSYLGYDNLFITLNQGIGNTISILIFICVAIIAFLFIKLFGASAPGSNMSGEA